MPKRKISIAEAMDVLREHGIKVQQVEVEPSANVPTLSGEASSPSVVQPRRGS